MFIADKTLNMDKKINVLVVPSDKFGVGLYRSVSPHTMLNTMYGNEFDVEIEYDPLLGAYSDTVPVGESIVDAIWVPNEEMTDCKPAFDLFEMLYPTIEDMQQIALIKIKDELIKNLENLRKFYSLPELNASDIMPNLLFEVMIFETTGEFEFSFESTDPICLRISASGTYESPFSKIIIENTEDEEI